MCRSLALLAAALTAGLGAATIPSAVADSSASAKTPTAVRVSTPCDGGAGTMVLKARATDTGGTAIRAVASDLRRHRWWGDTHVGHDYRDLDGYPILVGIVNNRPGVPRLLRRSDDGSVAAVDGTITATRRSSKTWPKAVGASMISAVGGVACIAEAKIGPDLRAASTAYFGVTLRPSKKLIRVRAWSKPGTRWRVSWTATSPRSAEGAAATVTAGEEGIDLKFNGVGRLRTTTKVVVRMHKVGTDTVRRLATRLTY
ncbi:MAG: hypothetical protein QM638_00225 [Nocardioides sp.]|uniref:hypothetical protein n=1 Tax=Nocardioides sp. TaxID=35761 RepID=UPI0039E6F403